ncbi:MAG: DUF1036 domain-containing protein [Flavobacteriia bacterium]|nr:DUF1036 domain-containing protein [Flavobacteriia bacterium]
MNSQTFLFFITLLITLGSNGFKAQEFGRGLINPEFDSSKFIKKIIPVTRGELPAYFTLESYAPPVGNQGQLGSCTSWASAYHAFTIVKRIEHGNNIGPFDPINLHNRLKAMNSKDPCSGGNYVEQAANILTTYGCPTLQFESCGFVSANESYSERLANYENLSINSYDFKYVLSQTSSPIVISAHYYTDGWSKAHNLVDGVWNGNCLGTLDGGHAMVILGYDDYKAGGAFLVLNSWGSDWGNKGYFWIKYSDISKVIYDAIAFEPGQIAEEEIVLLNDDEQIFRFYNDCSLNTYVTLSQNIGENWITEGWYAISSNGYVDIPISNRTSNDLYWMAVALNNGSYVKWIDNSSNVQMCYDIVNAHKIYNNDANNCPNEDKFYKYSPENRFSMVTMTLSCPNITTRSNEVVILPKLIKSEVSKNMEDNRNWNGKIGLLDPYSTRPILPNAEGLYDVYYLKKSKIQHFLGTAEDLMKIKNLKFLNQFNASAYSQCKK